MSSNYQRDEQRMHHIAYHLVWTAKRTKPVLTGGIASDCRELIEEECTVQGWRIMQLDIQPDYIHLFVQAFPTTPAADIVKDCKWRTSHNLRNRYPELRKLPSLWTRSYFATTEKTVSPDTIRTFVAAQKGM